MSSTIYLIGPSKVGKSTIGEVLHQQRRMDHRDLDATIAERAGGLTIAVAQDRSVVGPILEELETSVGSLPLLVTVGAGTQDRDRQFNDRWLELWLAERANRVIFVNGDPDVLFARSVAHRGNRERFEFLEFGRDRLRLYATASMSIDVRHLTKEDVADQAYELAARAIGL